jgi:hypothetical protein
MYSCFRVSDATSSIVTSNDYSTHQLPTYCGKFQIMDSQAHVERILPSDPPEKEVFASLNHSEDGFLASHKKFPKPAPKEVEPLLTSFTKFPELPIEIRQIIWRLTLRPRAVEIYYSRDHGFYSRVQTPVALKVCNGARKAVRTYTNFLSPVCVTKYVTTPEQVILTYLGRNSLPSLFRQHPIQPQHCRYSAIIRKIITTRSGILTSASRSLTFHLIPSCSSITCKIGFANFSQA